MRPETAQPAGLPRLQELGTDLLYLSRCQVSRALVVPLVAFVAFWIFAGLGHWVPAVFSLVVLSFVTYGSTSHDLVHGSLGLRRLTNHILLAIIEGIS